MTLGAVLDVVRAHFEQPACIVHSVDGSTVVEGSGGAGVRRRGRPSLAALLLPLRVSRSVGANRWVFTVLSPGPQPGAVAAMVVRYAVGRRPRRTTWRSSKGQRPAALAFERASL